MGVMRRLWALPTSLEDYLEDILGNITPTFRDLKGLVF